MVSFCSLAKLGDTQELEEFIADLDKVLEGMYMALSTRLSHRYGTASDTITVVSAEMTALTLVWSWGMTFLCLSEYHYHMLSSSFE